MDRTCAIDGCKKSHEALGLCKMHYMRKRRFGSPNIGRKQKKQRQCSVDGCTGKHLAKGFCSNHYNKNQYSSEYNIWVNMKQRCYNPKSDKYPYYGARGIKVCERWRKSYSAFLKDMGRRPSDSHSIDRVNNDGDYSPDNCKWSTREEQMQNTRRSKKPEFYKAILPLITND